MTPLCSYKNNDNDINELSVDMPTNKDFEK